MVVSDDGQSWSKPVVSGEGAESQTTASFAPREAKFVKIELITDSNERLYWSIHELEFVGSLL